MYITTPLWNGENVVRNRFVTILEPFIVHLDEYLDVTVVTICDLSNESVNNIQIQCNPVYESSLILVQFVL